MNKVTRCVHCRTELVEATRDHVFPASWYPETTPAEVQRWTVPSCRKCNNELGKMEKELFIRLAMCVDPRKAEAAGISAKVKRAMGIGTAGLRPKEHSHRAALKSKFVRSMERYEPGIEVLPGLGPHPGFSEHDQMSIAIRADFLQAVIKKIVRGSEFVLANRIIEKPYELTIYFVHQEDVPRIVVQAFQSLGTETTHLGPGFSVSRTIARDEPGTALYKIVMWGTLVAYAAILPEGNPDEMQ